MQNYTARTLVLALFTIMAGWISGCASDSYAAKGATQGAATGAVAGAVGGMMSALIFGGNVGDAAARGAVWGGSTGAVAGGMSGNQKDKAVKQQEQASLDAKLAKLKRDIGTDAFNGVSALTDCKHELALANAREAQNSGNRDFALAGTWLTVLTEADRQQEAAARQLFPQLIETDRDIKTTADAENGMRLAMQELGGIRQYFGMPVACPL